MRKIIIELINNLIKEQNKEIIKAEKKIFWIETKN